MLWFLTKTKASLRSIKQTLKQNPQHSSMTETTERRLLVEMPIKIKAYEIDAINIVSNIIYIKWFEDLRHAFLDRYYPYEEMMLTKVSPVLQSTQVDYLHHLTLYDKPIGRVWFTEMKGVRWQCEFEFCIGDKIHCRGMQRGFFINTEKMRPCRVPKQLIEAYEGNLS